MAKHRSSVFTVIREQQVIVPFEYEGYMFSAIIGTYQSLQRAEEVAGTAEQVFRENGVPDGEYRFTVRINTYYDE